MVFVRHRIAKQTLNRHTAGINPPGASANRHTHSYVFKFANRSRISTEAAGLTLMPHAASAVRTAKAGLLVGML